MRATYVAKCCLGIRRAGIGDGPGEIMKDVVEQRAALGRARIAQQGVDRRELQDAARIDGIGVAPQRLDLRHREAAGPCLARRRWLRTSGAVPRLRLVDRASPVEIACTPPAQRAGPVLADHRRQALQPARGEGRGIAGARRTGHHHVRLGNRHEEIMCGEAGPALRRVEVEFRLHEPGHEAVRFRPARPASLVQSADYQRVDALEPRFERTPDSDPAVGARGGLDRLAGDQRLDHVGPFRGIELQRGLGLGQRSQKAGKLIAFVAAIEV